MRRLRELKHAIRRELAAALAGAKPRMSAVTCWRPGGACSSGQTPANWPKGSMPNGSRNGSRRWRPKSCRWKIRSSRGWRCAAEAGQEHSPLPVAWKQAGGSLRKEDRQRTIQSKSSFSHLRPTSARRCSPAGRSAGQGLRDGPMPRRRFRRGSRTATRGQRPCCRPAASRTASPRSSTARSARRCFRAGKKHISFQVMGRRSSAVRLVSNNCQLNYKNYRALTEPRLAMGHVRSPGRARRAAHLCRADDDVRQSEVSRPAQRAGRRQGRTTSCRGRRRPPIRGRTSASRVVVLHDGREPPKPELSHLRPLFDWPGAGDAGRCGRAATPPSVEAGRRAPGADGQATDDDVRWLDALLQPRPA